jgi:potassium/hydrogen antiporter
MFTNEPAATALLITTWGILLAVSVLFGRVSQRAGVPVALLFILVGILSGSEGIGGIPFDDYHFAFRIGYFALALILFDGGLNTPWDAVRRYWAPAGVLATIGVVLTSGLVALAARLMGLDWPEALILGAVVSSTDAAAVFSILRGSGLHLKRRVGVTLELESGLNDPVAVILTTTLTANLWRTEAVSGWTVAAEVLIQLIAGAAAGLAIAWAGRPLLGRLRLVSGGLYPALTLAIAFLAFGVATLIHGSGFLAVYLAGLVLGNSELPYKAALLRVHDALAWLSQIGMFLILGLLVYPSRLMDVAPIGLGVALLLAFVLRPASVALCLLPFKYPAKEVAFIGWVGLRGAVPIVLGTFPILADAPGAERIFNLVFFLVVVSALVPGGTVAWVARRLRLESAEPPAPQAVMAIESRQPLRGELLSFYIDEALIVSGVALSDLDFPEDASVALIVRGDQLVAPRGSTVLRPGDHVYVIAREEDRPLIQLIFGRPESSE